MISNAGPDQLAALQSGLLNFLVKYDKGHMHQIMLEDALVVPGLSQNQTNILLKMDTCYSFQVHTNQSGLVLNKEPKFKSDEIKRQVHLALRQYMATNMV